MLEKKYQEASIEADAALLKAQKATFECGLAKQEKNELL
jgi:hypothetical protein